MFPCLSRFVMPPALLVVLHQSQSCTGRIGRMLKAKGYRLQICRPACGETLPADLSPYQGVVVFGGPMSANDETAHIRREIDWIGEVLHARVSYLGICLGAQMLARQLGAPVAPHPEGRAEIGFHPIWPTSAGRALLPQPLHVYQRHKEGFALPRGAALLARGAMFENQLFRYGEAAYGLQFHPEVTFDIMCRLHKEERCAVLGRGMQGMAEQHLLKFMHGPKLAYWLDGFLSTWLSKEPDAVAEPALRAGAQAPA
jgi:GMP synthase (glutamine-hydrolysing)